MNILLTDDDEKVLQAIGEALAIHGHRVRTASDGETACRLMRDAPADLVISDIGMPGMGGLELLQEVRKQYPGIPFIVMTGDRDLDTAVEAFRGGACDYIKKPVNVEELLARIEACERGRNRRQL